MSEPEYIERPPLCPDATPSETAPDRVPVSPDSTTADEIPCILYKRPSTARTLLYERFKRKFWFTKGWVAFLRQSASSSIKTFRRLRRKARK